MQQEAGKGGDKMLLSANIPLKTISTDALVNAESLSDLVPHNFHEVVL